MQRRWLVSLMAVSGAGLASALVATLFMPPPAPGHRPLHVNCPPGSHSAPDKANVARNLDAARAAMAARRMTAGHPGH
jgi:hypothetical protein